MKTQREAWIVAAGTGGHIFPGLNLAKRLQQEFPAFKFLFFGTADRLEATLVPKHGFEIYFLSAGQWKGRGPLAKLWGLAQIFVGLIQVFALIAKRGRPEFLLGTGGYVSLPVALACGFCGVPIFIVEPNIKAGMANKLVSRLARLAFTAPGSDSKKALGCEVLELGNPIREDIRANHPREFVREVLVLGGSQGAVKLSDASLELVKRLQFREKGIKLILQVGEKHIAVAQAKAQSLGLSDQEVKIVTFIDDVPRAMSDADLVIARAGAMTVSELTAAAVPTVFVPFPFAADDHQTKNAEMLEKAGAALMVLEVGPEFVERLARKIEPYVTGSDAVFKRRELSSRLMNFSKPRATYDISRRILESLNL